MSTYGQDEIMLKNSADWFNAELGESRWGFGACPSCHNQSMTDNSSLANRFMLAHESGIQELDMFAFTGSTYPPGVPQMFTHWTDSDTSWFQFVTRAQDGWLANTTIVVATPGNLTSLLLQYPQLMNTNVHHCSCSTRAVIHHWLRLQCTRQMGFKHTRKLETMFAAAATYWESAVN